MDKVNEDFRLHEAAGYERCKAEVKRICAEMESHWSAIKDTALLNGDVELSNASSGEPRAAAAIAALVGELEYSFPDDQATRMYEWREAESIRDLPEVDECIKDFAEEQSGDNATEIVRAVMRVVRGVPASLMNASMANVPYPDSTGRRVVGFVVSGRMGLASPREIFKSIMQKDSTGVNTIQAVRVCEQEAHRARTLNNPRKAETLDQLAKSLREQVLMLHASSPVELASEDTKMLNWLGEEDGLFYNLDRISAIVGSGFRYKMMKFSDIREAVKTAMNDKERSDAK